MASRRPFDAVSSSEADSDRNSGTECMTNAKRFLIDKCLLTPRSKPQNTPGSKRILKTGVHGSSRNLRMADPIGVYCRVRPWGESDEDRCVKVLDEASIILTPPENSLAWRSGAAKELTYRFQRVYGPHTDQKTIFENVALPLIEDVFNGKNSLLFAYGVTGSGKTFTMSGHGEDQGVMPRCLDVIFNSINKCQAPKFVFKPDRLNGFDVQSQADAMTDKQKDNQIQSRTPRGRNAVSRSAAANAMGSDVEMGSRVKETRKIALASDDLQYSVFVTYVEIYNNFVYDLLDENCWDERTKKFNLQSKMLREDASHNIYVNGVVEVEVSSADEAFEVFLRGQRRRKQAQTVLNASSSRSHAIFNIRLVQAPLDMDGEEVCDDKSKICVSQLSLVDLAGSERHGRTQAAGDRLKEAGNINNSLMTLRKCMDILRENQQQGTNKPVPYRESKLVHYLKNYFDGEGRVRMIICLNPRNEDYDENIHVMTFAELTKEIQVVRPTEKRLDPYTPGRRKANEMFKEARRRLVDEIPVDENIIPVDVNMVYGLGAPLPLGQMTKSDEEYLIEALRRALEQRIKSRSDLHKILLDKRHTYRMHLIELERNIQMFKHENHTLKLKLDQVSQDKETLESSLRTAQFEKNEQDIRREELEAENRQLKEELDTCKMELRRKDVCHLKDKERLKTDLELQKELNEMKLGREMQKKAAMLRESYKCKEKTFEAIRQLIESTETEEPRRSRSHRRYRSSSFSSATSDSEIQITATSHTRAKVVSATNLNSPSALKTRSAGIAVTNPRRFRARSSDNDRWLEHTPGQPLKSGTVFQPQMKKKKSVNTLTNVKDIVKNTSKYCLNLQEADSDGGVETKLYKADVLPSCTGGAQVVFNDVEILKQVSPSNARSPCKKRTSSAMITFPASPLRGSSTNILCTYDEMDAQLQGEAIAQRCSTGVGHLSASKRSRQQ